MPQQWYEKVTVMQDRIWGNEGFYFEGPHSLSTLLLEGLNYIEKMMKFLHGSKLKFFADPGLKNPKSGPE